MVRVNGKIRAREVRVIGPEGQQLGVIPLHQALSMARAQGVDLVEVASNAAPPVCRLVDFGKFRYEQSKKEKESKKHQHATKVKEVQLRPTIDPHDFAVKLSHAIGFLCEEMKVKVTLRFRGREMAHKEIGFQTVDQFLQKLEEYGHPDAAPRLVGRGINVMISPLPKAKRPKPPARPKTEEGGDEKEPGGAASPPEVSPESAPEMDDAAHEKRAANESFENAPFASLDTKASP